VASKLVHTRYNILVFRYIISGLADDLNIIDNNDEESITQNTSTFISEAEAISLVVNDNKTKVMKLLPTNNHASNVVIQGHTLAKVHQFTYHRS